MKKMLYSRFFAYSSLISSIAFIAGFISCNQPEKAAEVKGGGGPNSDLVRNSVSAVGPVDTNSFARITFEEPIFDFGEVNEGTIVQHTFKFTNTGKVPLTIMKARSSCGCTVPEWPEAPIPPGGRGEIKVKFDTEGKGQKQKKAVTVTANTYPNETVVELVGVVNPVKKRQ